MPGRTTSTSTDRRGGSGKCWGGVGVFAGLGSMAAGLGAALMDWGTFGI